MADCQVFDEKVILCQNEFIKVIMNKQMIVHEVCNSEILTNI